MELTLETPVQYIPRVGPAMSERLQKLDILTVGDLLYHIPFRYDDFSLISSISQIQPGETVTVKGTVISIRGFYTKNGKKIQEAKISDATGTLTIVWFNQMYILKMLKAGDNASFSGPITWFGRTIVMNSPQFEKDQAQDAPAKSLHTGRLVPIYPETEGVSSKWLRGRIAYVLEHETRILEDFLPESIKKNHTLPHLAHALTTIHFPETITQSQTAKRRLAFDELFTIHIRALQDRALWEQSKRAPRITTSVTQDDTLLKQLPFALTEDQQESIDHIAKDLKREIPMRRLLVGDVGSGKTVVAMTAIYAAYLGGYSSVFMAPTEILANQHYNTLSNFLRPLGIHVELVTSSTRSTRMHIQELSLIESNNTPRILVGTHALITDTARPERIGVVVIDEQHRFGVHQREALLTDKTHGLTPHLLTMTATPIPRTIARTMFGSVDVSILSTLPSGRKKIKTWVVPKEKRTNAHAWIHKEISSNAGQAFFIYPLIEASESLETVKAVTTELKKLRQIFPDLRIGLLHGRLKSEEKQLVLDQFQKRHLDILATTSVVEVGIDIPNATIMLIESADRFGLGQLHQLRGRVGRGDKQSYCLLFTDQDQELPLKRLKALETIYSGPELAEVDLKLRGPGEVFGTKQHGIPMLKIANFLDSNLIIETHSAAKSVLQEDFTLNSFPLLREAIKKRIIETVED